MMFPLNIHHCHTSYFFHWNHHGWSSEQNSHHKKNTFFSIDTSIYGWNWQGKIVWPLISLGIFPRLLRWMTPWPSLLIRTLASAFVFVLLVDDRELKETQFPYYMSPLILIMMMMIIMMMMMMIVFFLIIGVTTMIMCRSCCWICGCSWWCSCRCCCRVCCCCCCCCCYCCAKKQPVGCSDLYYLFDHKLWSVQANWSPISLKHRIFGHMHENSIEYPGVKDRRNKHVENPWFPLVNDLQMMGFPHLCHVSLQEANHLESGHCSEWVLCYTYLVE